MVIVAHGYSTHVLAQKNTSRGNPFHNRFVEVTCPRDLCMLGMKYLGWALSKARRAMVIHTNSVDHDWYANYIYKISPHLVCGTCKTIVRILHVGKYSQNWRNVTFPTSVAWPARPMARSSRIKNGGKMYANHKRACPLWNWEVLK